MGEATRVTAEADDRLAGVPADRDRRGPSSSTDLVEPIIELGDDARLRRRAERSGRRGADRGHRVATPRGSTRRACRRRWRTTSTAAWPPPRSPTPRSARTSPTARPIAEPGDRRRVAGAGCRPTRRPTRSTTCSRSTDEASTLGAARAARCSPRPGLLVLLVAGADLAGDAAGRDAGADGAAGGRAAGGRPAPGAAAGLRRGRPRAAGDVLQPDGDQPAAPDPPARGALAGAAAVRRRRLPRAADPADDGPDGRRRAPRRARRLRPDDRPGRRAAADRARPVRGAAGRPARDQPLRRRRRGAGDRRRQPGRRRPPDRRRHLRPRPAERLSGCSSRPPTTRASPRPTYAGSSGSCATWSPTRSTTPRAATS